MDPFQQLLDFSKLLYKQEDQDQIAPDISESLQQLRIDRPAEVTINPAEACRALQRVKDFREVANYMEQFFDPADIKAVQLRIDPALIRRDKMARKQYLYEKFRDAAWRSCKRHRKMRDHHGEPFSRFVTKQANVTVIPTKTTSAVYLSRVFKYAVKRTILEHKRELGGDPWDEFFYRIYSINRDNMRLEFAREDVAEARSSQDPSPGPSARIAKLSDTLMKGEARGRSPSPLMTAIVGSSTTEREETNRRRKIQRVDVSPSSHPRFRFGRVPHSPDGRTSLTRLFYLPLIDKTQGGLSF